MSYFFTKVFKDALYNNAALMNGATIKLVLFRAAPLTDLSQGPWVANAATVADLVAFPGWAEVSGIAGYPLTRTLAVSTRAFPIPASNPVRNNRYVMYTDYSFSDLSEPVSVQAIGVQFIGTIGGKTDPLIFVTSTPSGNGTNIFPGDSLTSNPVTFPDSTSARYIFGWSDPLTGGTTVDPVEGPLAIFRAPPPFEASNTLHLWLYPQRANMVANPSFELDAGYWASSGALSRVADPAPGGGTQSGRVVGGPGLILESNEWPTRLGEEESELWTLRVMAKGDGKLKVGLIFWDADYRGTGCDWGSETWQLYPDAWVEIACLRHGPQAHRAMMRLETDGGTLSIDRVGAEHGAVKEFDYFDGDTTYSAPDAYGWYGGSSRKGKSYSMLYINRRAVMGRLFATPTNTDDPDDVVTDDEIKAAGMVYSWVPAGVSVIPHIDVFYPNDLRMPPPTKGAAVLPRFDVVTQPYGVSDPWV